MPQHRNMLRCTIDFALIATIERIQGWYCTQIFEVDCNGLIRLNREIYILLS